MKGATWTAEPRVGTVLDVVQQSSREGGKTEPIGPDPALDEPRRRGDEPSLGSGFVLFGAVASLLSLEL
jgi:hypothetical protein